MNEKINYMAFPGVGEALNTKEYVFPFLPSDDEVAFMIEVVAKELGVNSIAVKSKNRRKNNVKARMFCCYMLRHKFHIGGAPLSFVEIGKYLGDRDHSTIIYNLTVFKDLYETEEDLRNTYHAIENKVIMAIMVLRMGKINSV